MMPDFIMTGTRLRRCFAVAVAALILLTAAAGWSEDHDHCVRTISDLCAWGDRSSGTEGNRRAATYIKERLSEMGLSPAVHRFAMPARCARESHLSIPASDIDLSIHPLLLNAVSVEATGPGGFSGPLVYVGKGSLSDFNGHPVEGAVILMDLDSGKNWLNAASLGAAALVYVDWGSHGDDERSFSSQFLFEEKLELTPIRFPRFWIPASELVPLQKPDGSLPAGKIAASVEISAEMSWQRTIGENIYCLIPGKDASLQEELLIVEAFYDSLPFVAGRSPGADEALGVATLLSLGAKLAANPPGRSVMLVATTGHAQFLTGMRELVWSIRVRGRELRRMDRNLKATIKEASAYLANLGKFRSGGAGAEAALADLKPAMEEAIKTEVDRISHQLIRIRLAASSEKRDSEIRGLVQQRSRLRQLTWREDFAHLPPEDVALLAGIIPKALETHNTVYREALQDRKLLKSAKRFRKTVKEKELAAIVSLHLSSHGDGIGAFNRGFQYPLTTRINRVEAYSKLDEALFDSAREAEKQLGRPSLLRDTLRPNRQRSWQSYFLDQPSLGGEVGALAGYLGVSLVTVNDARSFWGTPNDLPGRVDSTYAARQEAFTCRLLENLTHAPVLQSGTLPRDGFSIVTGRANFLRHGELFADQPAPGSVVLGFQGPARYHAMVNSRGQFLFKGIADKKHVLSKLIMEGYRFEPETGEIVWAIDKKKTGKSAYRLKMQRRYMETDLIMFACDQTTLFSLLEPRSFQSMTKIQLIEGAREAPPLKYWYSRIDTRESTLASIFLEPRSRLKMTLSDSVVRKKLILTGATRNRPEGIGYPVEDFPFLHNTPYYVARDMWALLAPRIDNLETHGIFDERLRSLQQEGSRSLQQAEKMAEKKEYDRFSESSARSWALASRVYDQVEATQKDVLFGVLFYIALFVPFAFCAERLLFAYTEINKRILAFSGILVLLIAIVYAVHPAFQLAYSPLVVVLAFFIIGLSVLVTLIIFFRFEEEMVQLQRRASHVSLAEISHWKAFTAAFFLGVSNLRRRRLRTFLTCATLVILTFTIMSFTTVKTVRQHARVLYQSATPYKGLLLKNVSWKSLPREAFETIANAFDRRDFAAPRAWLSTEDQTQAIRVPVRFQGKKSEARGLMGLSAEESAVTGIEKILVSGRWLLPEDRQAVLLPEQIARSLSISPDLPEKATVYLWGMPFTVVGVFSGAKLQAHTDLDGEELTPVTFPREVVTEMTEVEMEAFESGDDVKTFQSRYQHISSGQTLIVPYRMCLALRGELKSVAVRFGSGKADIEAAAGRMVDRFGLSLFSGEENGTFLYQASDTLSYSGVPNIIIPLIISVLIVLNTMIGSVYERKREIGIYTSVGLAPSHVSFLFVAEALAFAVLSVVSGYVLAQVSASVLVGSNLFSGITVNYSSLSGVGAMVLVMLVVLVSAIYPSKVAADLSIPDVNRSWKMPDSKESVIALTLPFMIKKSELRGVAGYLYAYFQAHQDVSHGVFSTGNISMEGDSASDRSGQALPLRADEGEEEPCLRMQLNVWLAPFDFGIMQRVELTICPSAEDNSFLGIQVVLKRKSGEMNAWWRINKLFLNNLRKQMLIWRSLDREQQVKYEKKA